MVYTAQKQKCEHNKQNRKYGKYTKSKFDATTLNGRNTRKDETLKYDNNDGSTSTDTEIKPLKGACKRGCDGTSIYHRLTG